MIYAFGSYGTGNLGDDAIFKGIVKEYHPEEVTEVYINTPSYHRNLDYDRMRKDTNREYLRPNDTFIIGGGGLFHSKGNILCLNELVDIALRYKMKVQIRGIGCEGNAQNEELLIQELCSKASLIEVRSKESKRILDSYKIDNVIVKKDFAYNIEPDIQGAKKIFPEFKRDYPIVGIVTAGSRNNLEKLSRIIRYWTINRFNVLHIPHCRHYTDRYCNDLATGEILWSNIDVYYGKRLDCFKLLPYARKPEILLGVYHLVDIVIGMRYHSFIFSEMANKPIFGLTSGSKATNYFIEHPGKNYLDMSTSGEILLDKTYRFAEAHRKC